MFRWLVRPDLASLLLRLMLAAIFIGQGGLKVLDFDWGTSWYREPNDSMAPALQAVVAWGELVCGLALALGLLTRLAAFGIIAIMCGAIYKVTWKLDFTNVGVNRRGFMIQEVGYEYNYAIIVMCACVIILGAGVVSLDHFLWRRRRARATTAPVTTETPVPARA
jgi:putative oxidoreductase